MLKSILKQGCPRLPAATITALTVATCGVLAEFVSLRPADLGQSGSYPGPRTRSTSDGSWKRREKAWIRQTVLPMLRTWTTPCQTTRPTRWGVRGEAIAMRLLRSRGWLILKHSYRLGRREIDVIARRADILAFVEVKTRAGRGWGGPEEAVTAKKRQDIDAGRVVRCEHIDDAWRPSPLP